jgi:hypothetical protein
MSIHSLPRGAVRMPARAIAGTRLDVSAGSRPCKSGFDAELVIYRLEEASSTLLALPATGYSPRLKQSRLEIVRTALEAYGWEPARDGRRCRRQSVSPVWTKLSAGSR